MNAALLIALAVIVILALSIALLRIASRHYPTACPTWAAFVLENPYMDAVAGSTVLLNRARIEPGMRVLDVGCGPGRLALPAAQVVGPSGRVVAIDLQEGMIAMLRQRMHARGITNIDTVVAGAGTGQVELEAFDRALLIAALGEIVDQAAALREIYSALRPGGLLSVTEVLPDPHFQSRPRVRHLAEAAGFHLAESFGWCCAFTINFAKSGAV